jgi:dihydropteroate synthase
MNHPNPLSPELPGWRLRNHSFVWGKRTYLMGVLNVTPDSFSDGGQFNSLEQALTQAKHLVATGADLLDIGGQSTRPQAADISLEEELNRVIPVVQAIRQEMTIPISVDTTKAEVARRAIAAGADLVNDISAATFDPQMLPTVAALGVPIILMHMRGTPQTMQQLTSYGDLIGEICEFLQARAVAAIAAGIGFAKTAEQNLEILRCLANFRALGYPLLVGPSRKSFIGQILTQPDPKQRVWGTAAASCAVVAGGADILRVHDVQEMQDVCRVADAIWR